MSGENTTAQSPAVFAVLATPNYLPYAEQVLAAAHRTGRWPGEYLLLAPGISEADRRRYEARGIHVRDVPHLLTEAEWAELGVSKLLHHSTMTRLHLFREEFKRWSHVVYLDLDTVIFGPIASLGRVRKFSAQLDMTRYLKWQFAVEERATLLAAGLDPLAPALCGGLLAFPTSVIEPGTFAELTRLAHDYLATTRFGDQGMLNVHQFGKWRRLPPAYNCFRSWLGKRGRGLFGKPLIVHCAGLVAAKPWDPASPFHETWKENRAAFATVDFRRPPTPAPVFIERLRAVTFLPAPSYYADAVKKFFVVRYHEGRVRLTDGLRRFGWYPKAKAVYRRLTSGA